MPTTLFDATLALARILTTVAEGVATGGSVTEMIDKLRDEPDEHYTGGTLWQKAGNNIGVSAKVLEFHNETGTITVATQSGANAATDTYAVASADYPRDLLIQAINIALEKIGDLPKVDITVLTVADQIDYDLPTGVRNIKRVRVGRSETTPYDYQLHRNYREQNGKIKFDINHIPIYAGCPIELTYKADHAVLVADTDEITEGIPVELVKWEAAVRHAIPWRLQRVGRDNPAVVDKLLLAQAELRIVTADRNIQADMMPSDPHLAPW